jgi:hypothetical protein
MAILWRYCSAVTQDARLPNTWKRFVPESLGRLRHACVVEATIQIPDFMAQLAQNRTSEYSYTSVCRAKRHGAFLFCGCFQLWTSVCLKGFAFSTNGVGASTRINEG